MRRESSVLEDLRFFLSKDSATPMIVPRLAVLFITIALLAGFGFGDRFASTERDVIPAASAEIALASQALQGADDVAIEAVQGEVVAQAATLAIDSLLLHALERHEQIMQAEDDLEEWQAAEQFLVRWQAVEEDLQHASTA